MTLMLTGHNSFLDGRGFGKKLFCYSPMPVHYMRNFLGYGSLFDIFDSADLDSAISFISLQVCSCS